MTVAQLVASRPSPDSVPPIDPLADRLLRAAADYEREVSQLRTTLQDVRADLARARTRLWQVGRCLRDVHIAHRRKSHAVTGGLIVATRHLLAKD